MINAKIECKKSLSPLSRKCYLNREWPLDWNVLTTTMFGGGGGFQMEITWSECLAL
jgi:hypothetical protein